MADHVLSVYYAWNDVEYLTAMGSFFGPHMCFVPSHAPWPLSVPILMDPTNE
jgi:hypothetical protein